MVFSSLPFIFVFMPIFFGCYYLVPDRFKNAVLLIGSLSFYLVGTLDNPEYLTLFLLSILVDFMMGIWMEDYPRYRRVFLVFGIVVHLTSLVIFKYLGFILSEFEKVIPGYHFNEEIVLPIGISFYSFQGISYLVDVYTQKIRPAKSLLCYAVYLSMFAQLIAGPIVTYHEVQNELTARKMRWSTVRQGLATFILGLGLKVLLANPVGKLWTQIGTIGFESVSTPLAWMGILAYTFQIYFDFWGYSLMAVGLGKMLGFHLPKNFDHPYLSVTMTEFWRRWHITLGAWFREYVYIPLGGNRHGKRQTIRNLGIVWLLTGIWHGAGYHFILWGLVLWVILVLERFWIGSFFTKHRLAGHLYMMLIIPLTWAIFAIDDISQLGVFFTRLFPFFNGGMWSSFRYDYVKYFSLYYPFLLAGLLFSTRLPVRLMNKLRRKRIFWIVLLVIFGASVYCLQQGLNDPFLYFQF
ncbi:MAG TPA: MBOAT family protein [Candidatus Fimiplasma intestinipullorum]|uniref:MBOAT family protein n=1 Tax=Candidatus Fimiplasma intestinipullorum TaxID=2840825 RepID=A0A9D1L0V4_9FIRM|nr:MBOAT family protein [Candidatus Fimiplasma intestinipullorum]